MESDRASLWCSLGVAGEIWFLAEVDVYASGVHDWMDYTYYAVGDWLYLCAVVVLMAIVVCSGRNAGRGSGRGIALRSR